MELIKINSNNRPYYSDDFIKGFECGAKRQFEADKKARPKEEWTSVLAELHEQFSALEKEIRKASAEMSAIIREYVDRPQGEWIWSPRDMDGTVSGCCSNCSFSHLFIGGHTAQYNFCPNCGADMREREGE